MSIDEDDYDVRLKCLLTGNSGIGKTCICERLAKDRYSDSHKPTVGVEFYSKKIDINGNIFKLQIWDIAGRERYKYFFSGYYKGAKGILLIYDITDLNSFLNLKYWLTQIEKYAPENVCKILVGNKCDIENKRKVTVEQGKDFATKYGMKFFETSAKKAINISEVFDFMTRDIDKELIKDEEKNVIKDIKAKVDNNTNNNNINELEQKSLDEKEKNKKLEEENIKLENDFDDINKLKKEFEKIKKENEKLQSDLFKADKLISNLHELIKKLKEENINLNTQLTFKLNEIKDLNNKLQNIKIEPIKKVNYEDIMVVTFISQDSSVQLGIRCLPDDIFAEVEEKLYKKYDNMRETNNMFTVNAKPILRFKKIKDNNIKDEDVIILYKLE